MEQQKLRELLSSLITAWESELVEFKEASNDYKISEIAKYFSALSNEANIRGKEKAWLVFGVNDKTRKITGTNFRRDYEQLQSLKGQIKQITGSISFMEIYEVEEEGKRVILFEIPAAPCGIPVLANGHAYSWAGESLKALDFAQLDTIRNQTLTEDWSAHVVPEAGVDDLDASALKKARQDFIQKHKNRIAPEEIASWPEETFLSKLHLINAGNLTRAAVLLFGKSESWGFLSPHPAQLTWRLEGPEKAYEHFGLPFYLTSSELYSRIRNIQLRILPDDSLVSLEFSKYDKDVIMEALHNCIIHQDYTLNSRVIVTEYQDRLEFLSAGYFFEGKPDDYIEGKQTPQRYRNPCLANAMSQLNMIDSMGMGIAKMYQSQAKRYFPLPDYDLTHNQVKLTIHGKIVDPAYTRLLLQNTDLPISDILALDRIQKRLPIPSEMISHLRKKGLIEGRKPHLHISVYIAQMVPGGTTQFYLVKEQGTAYYADLLLRFITENNGVTRQDIEQELFPQLSISLSKKEKSHRVSNLITSLRRRGLIDNLGTRSKPFWVLTNAESK